MTEKNDKRDKRVPLLLTQAERDLLEAHADHMGLGLSTFIRVMVLEHVRGE